MADNKHYLAVNWVDGMKVNKEHFIASDRHLTQGLKNAQSQSLNPFNYGIVLQTSSEYPSLDLSTDIDNQARVHVKVLRCQALTRSGSLIDIDNNYLTGEDFSALLPQDKIDLLPEKNNELYIAVSVNPYGRVPVGQANAEENPPRLPHVIPEYHISFHNIEEKKSVLTENSLIIGKLIIVDHKPEIDKTYIPPCQCTYSHPKLIEYHTQLLAILGQIEIDIVDILQGIKEKKQSTSISNTVAEISQSLLIFLGFSLPDFRRSGRYYPPVFMFETICAFARVINNIISIQTRTDREELFNYIMDWSSLKQGEFENLIKQAAEIDYDHDDINSSIKKIDPFILNISKIFNTLSNLDFIGKKKDRQIFVKEQKEKPSSSFLVD